MSPRHLASRRVRWALVAIVAAAILASSVTRPTGVRGVTGPLGLVGLDKYLHALAFGVLAGVLVVALAGSSVERLLAVPLVATVGYGLAIEVLQLPIPYRSFSLLDLGADAFGGATVALVWWGWQCWSRQSRERE